MKRLLDLLKNPRGAWLIVAWLLGIGAAAASIAVVVLEAEGGWVYAVYLAAAVLLAYAIYALVRFVPRATAAVSSFVKKYPLLGKWMGTYEARTLLFAACSFVINVGYVVLNIVMAALMSSIWYAALAAYYFALGALRYAVLFGTRKAKKNAQTERGLAAENSGSTATAGSRCSSSRACSCSPWRSSFFRAAGASRSLPRRTCVPIR